MKTFAIAVILALLIPVMGLTLTAETAHAQANVTVDPAAMTFGFMNVFELDCTTFVFNSSWGFADLSASFAGSNLTLSPNTINDPNEFWYQCVGAAVPPNCGGPGAPGNKCMEAIAHAQDETGLYAGQTLTFSGEVLSNTFTAHTTHAFIREFAPGFASLVNETLVPLGGPGPFTLSQAITAVGGPVQYGFITRGPNVWATDTAPFGTIVVGPEVSTPALPTTWSRVKATFE